MGRGESWAGARATVRGPGHRSGGLGSSPRQGPLAMGNSLGRAGVDGSWYGWPGGGLDTYGIPLGAHGHAALHGSHPS